MSNNNHNHSSCGFAEQMISYLYGEANQAERIKIEVHLKTCFFCADELAGFGAVRSSVLEWREEEFFKLAPPAIEMPKAADDSRSWLDGLHKIFTLNPAWAMAAVAVLIVGGGLILFALKSSPNVEVANKEKSDSLLAAASPTVEKIIESNTKNDVRKTSSDETSMPPKELKPEIVSDRRIALKNTVVKVSTNAANENKNSSAPSSDLPNQNNKKSPAMKKSQAPTLTNAEDEEDKSVRLTDLFAELDTK